jgi:hypothetical protein
MKLNFLKSGIQNCGVIYSQKHCQEILKSIYKTRNFKKIFLSEKEYFSGDKSNFKKNPSPGHNLLDKLDCAFIFENKMFKAEMKKTLGSNYRILDHKLVMGVPENYLPEWLKKLTKNNMTNNLGLFIKPQFRDVTYFKGIDFHQDIIDFPTRDADFVTAYIYLENVNKYTSPLYLLPGSHKFGATVFPHNLIIKNTKAIYKNKGKSLNLKILMLEGKPGSMSYWHPFILHGTQPHKFSTPRISVRLLVEKNRRVDVGSNIDKINKKICGDLSLKLTSTEYNSKGKTIKKGNKINLIK